ncbi:VOC family protein [Microbacterium lushaniae]|uniref:VOC family protein n=1 Tax=Microbacterium lushaniae TaxID=2614639 RepID=A0A5J6L5F4_9MICO|nr:VOC family protein [Microbacterium lushaniae]QEW03595.1 VOC family protein [Microbacterium lushaniae]
MTAPPPYVFFPGVAADALRFYRGVFGGELTLHTFADFGRDDGPAEAIAHGILVGPVDLFAADAAQDEPTVAVEGLLLSLLGAAPAATLEEWFAVLSEGGTVIDPLQERPWGASDGTVRDRYGLTWLIGYEPA